MWGRRFRLMLAFAALTAGSGTGGAEETAKPPEPVADDELLEFLGSVDPASDTVQPDDGSWIDYLSQTDISKVAKQGNPTVVAAKPATPPPSPPPKSSPSGAKQDE